MIIGGMRCMNIDHWRCMDTEMMRIDTYMMPSHMQINQAAEIVERRNGNCDGHRNGNRRNEQRSMCII